jgi:hypothetical protein
MGPRAVGSGHGTIRQVIAKATRLGCGPTRGPRPERWAGPEGRPDRSGGLEPRSKLGPGGWVSEPCPPGICGSLFDSQPGSHVSPRCAIQPRSTTMSTEQGRSG